MSATSVSSAMARPIDSIVFTAPEAGKIPPPPDSIHRAVHQIRLSSISHNYTCVESAAAQQRCSVIVVVKADGYGHGAIESAIHLADHVGADAFAVATLEEGIALRKAFETTPPAVRPTPLPMISSDTRSTSSSSSPVSQPVRCRRSPQIRILVLGPPVGYPRCFDEYLHYGIEVMCSGAEVAKAMMEWVSDEKARKRTEVERAANDAKQAALLSRHPSRDGVSAPPKNPMEAASVAACPPAATEKTPSGQMTTESVPVLVNEYKEPTLSATLGNVSGQDLAKEVRQFLMNQQALQHAKDKQQQKMQNGSTATTECSTISTMPTKKTESNGSIASSTTSIKKGQVFGGIEAVAKSSRTREMAAARAVGIFREDSMASDDTPPTAPAGTANTVASQKLVARKRLRYHVLVDSGMGRLGFKTQPVEVSDVGVRRDTVEIIQELVDMEVAGHPVGKKRRL